LAVRPFCHTDHYTKVMHATNRAIEETMTTAGFAVPELHMKVRKSEYAV
jgi:small conductance mechanosensitive channel